MKSRVDQLYEVINNCNKYLALAKQDDADSQPILELRAKAESELARESELRSFKDLSLQAFASLENEVKFINDVLNQYKNRLSTNFKLSKNELTELLTHLSTLHKFAKENQLKEQLEILGSIGRYIEQNILPWNRPIATTDEYTHRYLIKEYTNDDIFDLIDNLNQLLAEYDDKHPSIDTLKEIATMSEKIIESTYVANREDRLLRFIMERALNIAKQATLRLYSLSEDSESLAKSRWGKLRKIIGSQNDERNSPAKPLMPAFWSEAYFAGELSVKKWINNPPTKDWSSLTEFKGKNTEDVKYKIDLDQHEISFGGDAKLYLNHYQLLDSRRARSVYENENGYVIYTLVNKGGDYKLRVSDPGTPINPDFHHSSLNKGEPILCAGALKVVEGEIKEITMASGHYQPKTKQILQFLSFLQDKGVDLSKIDLVKLPGYPPINAEKYLQSKGNALPDNKALYYFLESKRRSGENQLTYLDISISYGSMEAVFEKVRYLIRHNLPIEPSLNTALLDLSRDKPTQYGNNPLVPTSLSKRIAEDLLQSISDNAKKNNSQVGNNAHWHPQIERLKREEVTDNVDEHNVQKHLLIKRKNLIIDSLNQGITTLTEMDSNPKSSTLPTSSLLDQIEIEQKSLELMTHDEIVPRFR